MQVIWELIPLEAQVLISRGSRSWGSLISMQLNKRIYKKCSTMQIRKSFFETEWNKINSWHNLQKDLEMCWRIDEHQTFCDILSGPLQCLLWCWELWCSWNSLTTSFFVECRSSLMALENHLAQTSMLSGLWAPSK